jgi:hypothetical protein
MVGWRGQETPFGKILAALKPACSFASMYVQSWRLSGRPARIGRIPNAMLSWLRKITKSAPQPAAAPASEPAGGEWDFLRDQPDHDADLMAGVRAEGSEESSPPQTSAAVALEAPAPPSPAPAPEPRRTSRAPAPRRSPGGPRRPAPAYSRPTGSATRPLTLLNDLCARFQQDQQVPGAWEGRYAYAAPGWVLTVRIETERGTLLRPVHGELTLGRRDPESGWAPDVDLPDDSVSRRHARIYRRSGRFWVQDLDSKNGTRHNGEWLSPGGEAMLLEGDEIALGETCRLRVVDPTFERDEAGLRSFALWALTETIDAERSSATYRRPAAAPAPPESDLLDLALQRGSEVGLIVEPVADRPE